MKRKIVVLLLLLFFSVTASAQTSISFDQFFLDKTMRVDYYHTGIKTEEIYSLDQVYEEPLWAGSKVNLIDTLNLGKYLVKVFDTNTNQLIYSRGYSSIFGEWQTTEEAAKGVYRTFHESVCFPYPKRPVQVVIATRDRENYFRDVFSTVIDPNSRFVNRERHRTNVKVKTLLDNGPPSQKVDLLILGDGYTEKEMKKFHKDARRFVNDLFDTTPFKERKRDFNVRIIEVISRDSGIDEPRKNIWKNTALGCSFNTFDTPRYVLTYENKALRDIASNAPYDQLYILLNTNRYGGGGIFNLYSTCITGAEKESQYWWPDYVFVHEFGHAFAGLGDEYYTSAVAYSDFYPAGVEPWEPNISALADKKHLRWAHLMEEGTPVPTPWDKTRYDSLDVVVRSLDRTSADYETKREEIRKQRDELLKAQKYYGKVGYFEGSGYASKGLYRPYLDCRMFSKSLVDFCPVCREAIEKMIDFYSR